MRCQPSWTKLTCFTPADGKEHSDKAHAVMVRFTWHRCGLPQDVPLTRIAMLVVCSVVDLYSQTSELLGVSAKWADSIRSAGLAKEALRILAERLAAVCCLRSAAFNTPRLTDCARRASDALREHHARKEQAWAAAGERWKHMTACVFGCCMYA